MLTAEWSLVFFTVIVQVAAGMLLAAETAKTTVRLETGGLLRLQAPIACGLVALGFIFSGAHLGSPMHSLFTLFNVPHSPLSREIVAVGLLLAAAIALAYLRLKKGNEAKVLGIVAAILGIVAVLSMTRVYMVSTVPVWNNSATWLGFLGTMLLVGPMIAGTVFLYQAKGASDVDARPMFKVFSIIFAVGFALKLIGIPMSTAAFSSLSQLGLSSYSPIAGAGTALFITRLLLLIVGVGLFCKVVLGVQGDGRTPRMNLCACAALLVVMGELLDRAMFFGAYARIGL
ncbi:MAG TPA: dimethyl sulfoxide reductase anchor subunit [Desulfovibrio sp.]|jgi:anaerobic dimethyl sulfoxide reductase subunit C (anchor subunit)|uniref:dimethyl sulfoxide reductase anchor subunit family protein n=1 Tax=Desulfovibrio TaxID=872 RepID=UPI00040F2C34|nr:MULTISPECIES: DmsC/YnfH family molybdoenzyme membrane anchor subunit [Desulfovibrio]HMM37512.1 dimethyl sulfoxide reductase anchor subunit [Desulfovibrio sp.]